MPQTPKPDAGATKAGLDDAQVVKKLASPPEDWMCVPPELLRGVLGNQAGDDDDDGMIDMEVDVDDILPPPPPPPPPPPDTAPPGDILPPPPPPHPPLGDVVMHAL